MNEPRTIRCQHDGITLKRLPAEARLPDHEPLLAFKRAQMRKWLKEERARQRGARRNVIAFGGAAK